MMIWTIRAILLAVVLYIPLGVWCAYRLPTVEQSFGSRGCSELSAGLSAVHTVAVVLSVGDARKGIVVQNTAAQENMDGTWTVNFRQLVRMAWFDAQNPFWHDSAWKGLPIRVLFAAPFLRLASADHAEAVATNPALWRCRAA